MSHRNCAIPEDRAMPGTVQFLEGDGGPTVIALFGQYAPGKPGRYATSTTWSSSCINTSPKVSLRAL